MNDIFVFLFIYFNHHPSCNVHIKSKVETSFNAFDLLVNENAQPSAQRTDLNRIERC